MMRFDRLCVVIPCHNEEACIDNVLAELEQRLPGATLAVVDEPPPTAVGRSSGNGSENGAFCLHCHSTSASEERFKPACATPNRMDLNTR